jgi:hypothetical protein
MHTLITGTFQAEQQAVQAVRKLVKSCVPMDLMRTILPGTRRRLAAHEAEGGHPPREPGSIMVAVKAPEYVSQCLVVKILRDHGAHEIECLDAERRAMPRLQIPISVRNHHAPAQPIARSLSLR